MTEYHWILLYWGIHFNSTQWRILEWRWAVARMGGNTLTIDATYDAGKKLYSAQDCENATDETIETFDKRTLQKPVPCAVLVGLNKYHFSAFTALTPNESEAHAYLLVPSAEYYFNHQLFSEKDTSDPFCIATDGLTGNINFHTKLAYAAKKIYKTDSIGGINIDEHSKTWKVYFFPDNIYI